jgi:8-amino-7-oxononanoate synthase
MSDALTARLEVRAAVWRSRALHRVLEAPSGVDLTSNDVLGLATDPRVVAAARDALDRGGTGAGGSRLLGGHRAVFDALEARAAAWLQTERALLFGSGYAASVGVLGALLGRGDVVVSDALNHASLIDGMRLCGAQRVIVPHLDVDAVRAALSAARPEPGGVVAVVVESVYSMDGDGWDLGALAALCAAHRAVLLVDEAHATGLYGPAGEGRVVEAGVQDAVFLRWHPCGKALGGQGCLVASSSVVVDALVQHARSFVFSTAPWPATAAALLAAIERVAGDPVLRARPAALAAGLRDRLGPVLGRGAGAIVPIPAGSAARSLALAHALAVRGWWVRPVRPPTVPEGTARVRVVTRAPLTASQIETLAEDVLVVERTI